MTKELTPLMKQYWDLKAKAPDALMFFRMGDFYELFGDDAIEASRILEITLTSRNKNQENPTPMAGVPHHSAQNYIQKLLDHGKKVVIVDQIEEASPSLNTGKDLVRREIVRTLTPAIQFDAVGSDSKFLAFIFLLKNSKRTAYYGVALDPSTGESLWSESPLTHFQTLAIKHLIYFENESGDLLKNLSTSQRTLLEPLPSNYCSEDQSLSALKKAFQTEFPQTYCPDASLAYGLGVLVHYLQRTQKVEALLHLRPPRNLESKHTLKLGPRTTLNLDLLPEAGGGTNLYDLLNRTSTSMGARELRRWITEPLTNLESIQARQTSLQELAIRAPVQEGLKQNLKSVYDLDRLLGRLSTRLMNPADTLALGRSLDQVQNCIHHLLPVESKRLKELKAILEDHAELLGKLSNKITTHQKEDAPLLSRDGGIFKKGYHEELDRLIDLTENGEKWLIDLETQERAATGIGSLKVKYNRVFGYFIEITHTHLKNVPAHYQRKQTTAGAERFFTEELKKFEEEILTATTRQKNLEQKLFEAWVEEIATHATAITTVARAFAELDVFQALTQWVLKPGWTFPKIDSGLSLTIRQGRHPLVDEMKPGAYVPNDADFDPQTQRVLMITGPNMGGKSTVMRQTAMIVLLGQMGAPVPALEASWGIFESIHTRIGAHDAITQGQSTFMVEMNELAYILRTADERSLILLDEIGRGTSTYDGISVAWATLEWICKKIKARTLFATHYHELTALGESLSGLQNFHMAVHQDPADPTQSFRFLYQLKAGATNDSFGIQVAKLAGLPSPLIDRAWKILENLETKSEPASLKPDPRQLSFFDLPVESVEPEPAKPDPVREELMSLNLNQMTPIQALTRLVELQEKSKSLSAMSS